MNSGTIRKIGILLLLSAVVLGGGVSAFAGVQDIVADIDRMTTLDGEDRDQLVDSIFSRIEKDTSGVVAALLPRLAGTEISDETLALYVLALGVAGAPEAVGEICRVAQETKSDLVRSNCRTALAHIGGNQSGECLLSALDNVSDPDERFTIFDLLGQMQYEAALPLALEILKSDAEKDYWRPIFVFGKMGDMAVPYLLEKTHDENTDVRYNAINVLGQWLIAPEATQPLQVQFFNEKDTVIKNLILSSLERIHPDCDALSAFMEEVISRADDKASKTFAEEAIELLKNMPAEAEELGATKQVSAEEFKAQYDMMWESYGLDGDYQILFSTSSSGDEPALKKLRERILQRNSDECFYDYRQVTDILYLNRLLTGLK